MREPTTCMRSSSAAPSPASRPLSPSKLGTDHAAAPPVRLSGCKVLGVSGAKGVARQGCPQSRIRCPLVFHALPRCLRRISSPVRAQAHHGMSLGSCPPCEARRLLTSSLSFVSNLRSPLSLTTPKACPLWMWQATTIQRAVHAPLASRQHEGFKVVAEQQGSWPGVEPFPKPGKHFFYWPANSLTGLSSTRRAVMLSAPSPWLSAGLSQIHSSNTSSRILESGVTPATRRSRTNEMRRTLVITSKTPSHASMKNSSSSDRSKTRTSGSAVMICSAGGSDLFCLYCRSPILRDKFRLPLTRPISFTFPPAALIRASSRSSRGLWSSESAFAVPAELITPRESPALATKSLLDCLSSTATTAVHPAPVAQPGP
mmetsp:Transcript_526/g.1578  ORF Transcript_526/g.1578 Transcript_526/m.1578 type:complete len:372 (-) Transcript_526:829-1944(-)